MNSHLVYNEKEAHIYREIYSFTNDQKLRDTHTHTERHKGIKIPTHTNIHTHTHTLTHIQTHIHIKT